MGFLCGSRTPALISDWPFDHLSVIDSTSSEAKRRAQSAFSDHWIIAEEQTAGRGRHDRAWKSPAGNLYATALFRERAGIDVALRMPFAAALAVTDVIQSELPDCDVRLKWPNDVRVDGRKLAGILIETGGGEEALWVAAGIGINIRVVPPEAGQPATSLSELGLAAERTVLDIFHGLRRAFAVRIAEARVGFSGLRAAWLSRAEGIGTQARIRLGNVHLTAVIEDLGADGSLILRLPDGSTHSIHAGEIVF